MLGRDIVISKILRKFFFNTECLDFLNNNGIFLKRFKISLLIHRTTFKRYIKNYFSNM